MNSTIDRREFKRFLFSDDSHVTAKLYLDRLASTAIAADIVNLSEQGLGLNFGRIPALSVGEGDALSLEAIEGLPELDFLVGVAIEIKWMISYQPSRGIRLGGSFIDISEDMRRQIKAFINTQISQKLMSAEEPASPGRTVA